MYFNDGKGNFTNVTDALPTMLTSKSCVRAADIDKDGDVDLFLGGRVVPGNYPTAPPSYLLINDGHGHFIDGTKSLPFLETAGMITDALWLDMNNDGYPDLITVGEFMPVQIFLNRSGTYFKENTSAFPDGPLFGLWNKVSAGDFDGDGDSDLVVGNHGLNSQFKASNTEMMELTYADFDKNGSIDPVLTNFIQHKPYPVAGGDEMLDQVISLRKKFTSYDSYAHAELTTLFSQKELLEANRLHVNELQTVFLKNNQWKVQTTCTSCSGSVCTDHSN